MVINIFIAHMGIGGSERVCVNLANEWAALDHEVHIVVLNLDNDINTRLLDKRVQVHELGVSRLRYAFIPMYRYIRRHKPQFMFIFGMEMAVIMNKLKNFRLINTPMIVRILNNVNISLSKEENVSPIVEKYLKNSQKQMKSMDAIVAQCRQMGDMLLDKQVVSEEQLHVIYNPVSKALIEATTSLRLTREHTGSREITFIGRIDPQKNVSDLISAYAIVADRLSDVTLRLVGGGIQQEAIEKQVAELGLSDRVIFDGIRQDMEAVYASSDVVVLSSDYEGMPNCLIEAIGCGIPIVSYDCPIGPAEIVVDGENGYLIKQGDIEALAQGMIDALNREWSVESVKKTCAKFDVSNIAKQYISIFDDILK